MSLIGKVINMANYNIPPSKSGGGVVHELARLLSSGAANVLLKLLQVSTPEIFSRRGGIVAVA